MFGKKKVVLDVLLYSYLNRPIFDIYLNNVDIGVANSYGGTGTITAVTIPFGQQTLTWRDAGTGHTFSAKNTLTLTPEQIPADARYIGIHIYPDDTVEFTFSQYMPDTTEKGQHILDGVNHGK